MANNPPVSVTVKFDPNNIGTTFNPVSTDIPFGPSGGLPIPQGTNLINFQLQTLSGGSGSQATFPSSPLQFSGKSLPVGPFTYPVPVPAGVTQFQVQDDNTNSDQAPKTYGFTVLVDYDGQTFQGDPVIINEPPGGMA
jgi:hypothetical protein